MATTVGTAGGVLRRVPPAAWALLGGAALLLPGLGSFGLWEPWESELALPAAAAARRSEAVVAALGLRLGGGEAGLRAGFVLLALAAVLVVYWAAAGLYGRRAGLLGGPGAAPPAVLPPPGPPPD